MQKTFLQPRRTVALGLVMALILTLFALPALAAAPSGTADDPYLIATEADLIAFREKVNGGETGACARLTADISITGPWAIIGTQDAPYTGTFDGDGHSLNNFLSEQAASVTGLFGYSNGTIQNLTVDTGNMAYVMGLDYTAILCAVNRGTIQNCTTKGSAYGYNDKAFVGGIAAVNFGTIANCTNEALIYGGGADACGGGIAGVSAEGSVSGCTNTGGVSVTDAPKQETELCVGGVVGLNYKSTIDRCTNTGFLYSDGAKGYTGGVAGLNNGIVNNSLNTARLTSLGLYGGVAGYVFTNTDTGLTAQVRSTLDTSGNVVYGKNEGGSVLNNFYQSDAGTSGAGQTAVTNAQLQSGEVAFRLNGNNTADPVWRQNLSSDTAPTLNGSDVVYAQYENGTIKEYTNGQSHTHTFDESGQCTVDGCGYASVKLIGWTLTLDGALGVTFYYAIDPLYLGEGYDVSVDFTMDGKTTNVPLDEGYSYQDGSQTVYGFRFYVDSDKATHDIAPVLTVRKDGAAQITLAQQQSYRIYDYLLKIVNGGQSDGYSAELVQLAKALATYDYYANEYFRYSDSYQPEISLLSLDGVTDKVLAAYKQSAVASDDAEYSLKHYGSNLYLQESVFPRYLAKPVDAATLPVDSSTLYMGYRVAGSGDLYTYVKATESGGSYLGNAAKRPASQLGTPYEIAFFAKEGNTYRQISPVKVASVYSYAYTVSISSAAQPSLRNVTKALYLYGEAAKNYFDQTN